VAFCGSRAWCCGRVSSDSHRLAFTQPRALGRRASDEFTVLDCGSTSPSCITQVTRLHVGEQLDWIPQQFEKLKGTLTGGGGSKMVLMCSLEPSIYVTYLLRRGARDDESEAVYDRRQSGGPPAR
jgi:hypothetical protein